MLRDAEVMYAYEHAFSEQEAWDWLRRQRERYRRDGFGLWAVIRKADGVLIGRCGLTMQPWRGRMVPEVGDLFCKDVWHQGYAAEAARAVRDYAFSVLDLEEVWSIIRDNNLPSRRVAERNGMQVRGQIVKHYYGKEMPHVGYSVRRERDSGSFFARSKRLFRACLCRRNPVFPCVAAVLSSSAPVMRGRRPVFLPERVCKSAS